jgi:hypothetical protein
MGDLQYGVDNVNRATFPSNSYLSSNNKASVQNYVCIFICLIFCNQCILFLAL